MQGVKRCLALLIVCFLIPSKSMLFYVVPHDTTNDCWQISQCYKFETFLHGINLTSHSTVFFDSGVYTMDNTNQQQYNIMLRGFSNVTFVSKSVSGAEIHCNKNFKLLLIFENSKGIILENIKMIDCSVQLVETNFVLNRIKTEAKAITKCPVSVSVLIIEVTNFSMINIHLSDSEGGIVLLGNTIYKHTNITGSLFNGLVLIQFSSPSEVNINIHDSKFYAAKRSSNEEFCGGVVAELLPVSAHLNIADSTFLGVDGVYGFLLKVSCSSYGQLYLKMLNTLVEMGGVLLNVFHHSDEELCTPAENQFVIYNCSFLRMLRRSGLQISNSMRCTSLKVKIEKSHVSESQEGLSISSNNHIEICDTLFRNNTNALSFDESIVTFLGENVITQNSDDFRAFSAMLLHSTKVYFCGVTTITNNHGQKYAAVYAENATLYIFGKVIFSQNTGFYGGALSLYAKSQVIIHFSSRMIFTKNHAIGSGGAIYVETESYADSVTLEIHCFYCYMNTLDGKELYFCNNTSIIGGDSIFGGSIDNCLYNHHNAPYPFHVTFCNGYQDTSLISSKPNRLCFCNITLDSFVSCDEDHKNVTLVPGQTLELLITAVGQRFGTIAATVQAQMYSTAHIDELQRRQVVYRKCSTVKYTVYGAGNRHTLYLLINELSHVDIIEKSHTKRHFKEIGYYTPEQPLSINIYLKECPLGFMFDPGTLGCICLPELEKRGLKCNISSQTIDRPEKSWVNATKTFLFFHKHCPISYCATGTITFSLANPDSQCLYNRSGTLCGQCSRNSSHILGSYRCLKCSNFWLFLLIPLTVISGFVLVFFLKIFNLTVTAGTINGLILYANIVRANNAVFFSEQTIFSTKICNVFIAWINLDLGIEVCFYDGLDSFAKTIFQLAFPIYICTIVVVMIVSSHYFTRAAKLIGNNAVQVLATLFLLSYSKSLRFVITVFSATRLTLIDHTNGTTTTKLVWLYDGNIEYLQGRHILLFLISVIILTVVSIPYTITLIFIQCLQTKSHYRCLSWVWKMKPIFDAYTGPYKNKHRYWTGLLIFVRVVLYMVYSMNIAGDPSINLLANVIITLLILVHLMAIGKVYKSKVLDTLEFTFLLNLMVLSICSLFAIHINSGQEIITNISVLFNLVLFGGIVIAHTYQVVKSTKVLQRILGKYKKSVIVQTSEDVSCKNAHQVTRQIVSIDDLEEPLIQHLDNATPDHHALR